MQKTLLVLFFLPACSYSFLEGDGGASGGAGGGAGSTVASTVGPSTTVTTVTASQSQAQSQTAVTQETVSVTAEQSSSTGNEPVVLPSCSAPWAFESQNDAWVQFDGYVTLEQGHVFAQVNSMSGRAFFGLNPDQLSENDCFVSIRMTDRSMSSIPRAVLLQHDDETQFVSVNYYGDGQVRINHLGASIIGPADQPDAFGFARYQGHLYIGYKSNESWHLVHAPSLPSWLTPGTQNARQQFGVGEQYNRWVTMDDYGADPISTTDIAGALAWP